MALAAADNLDFTQERVDTLLRIKDLKTELELEPTDFVSILRIVDEYAQQSSFLPDGWLECEDVLFESLARTYKAINGGSASLDLWIGSRIRDDFLSGDGATATRLARVSEHVASRLASSDRPTRMFRMYLAAHFELADRPSPPGFSVCSRMTGWINDELTESDTGPPGGE